MLIQPDFPDHWKTLRFIRELGDDPNGVAYLLRLWGHCQNQKQTSFEMPCYALAGICRFEGDPVEFEKVLDACGYIERDGDSVKILGFDEHNANMVVKWKNGKHGGRPRKAVSNNLKPISVIENETESTSGITETQSRLTNEVNKGNKGNKVKVTKRAAPPFDWDNEKDCHPSLNTPEVRSAYTRWCSYRSECNYSQYKPVTLRTKLRAFEGMSPKSFVDAVENSIGNGYQGLFPPNGVGKPKGRPNDKNTCGDQDILTKLKEQSI